MYKPLRNSDIRWNWEKFLIGKDGRPIKRYDPKIRPKEIEDDIREALGLGTLLDYEMGKYDLFQKVGEVGDDLEDSSEEFEKDANYKPLYKKKYDAGDKIKNKVKK